MKRAVCLFICLIPLLTRGQFTYTLEQAIPVQDLNGDELRLAWSGGLNAAQFNTMDLNGDGTDDLVLFDRMANKVITFLASNNTYEAAPQYENMFPPQLSSWLLLRDFNCDGKKDIFTGHTLGIKVFTNVSSDGRLAWEQHIFEEGFPDAESNVLMTEGSSTYVNLQLQPDDLPSISDVDGDGDLDIFNIQYMGHTVEFHQNLSMESGLPCGSLKFKRITRAWGEFRECFCGQFAFNNTACPPNSGGRTKHAGGKSLLAIDMNGDNQQELLFSEADCAQLFLLPNTGANLDPSIQTFSVFPQNNPVNFVLFPAPFFEDVDFDGKKDLIAVPNIFAKEFLNSNLQQSTWFYKNTGTLQSPNFTFVQRDFLQHQMIDVGDNSVPAFADYDGDGDFDMLISSHSSAEFTARVLLFENTGDAATPAFKLVADDYLGFSTSRLFNLKIQLADIDSDMTQDLVFTATNFDNNGTNLYYLRNKSQSKLDFTGGPVRMLDFALTSSENLYITDLNGDGLPDILAGRSEGNLEYWKNTGVSGAPQFALEEENYLGFDSSPLRQNLMVAVADLDADGNSDLVVGDQNGKPALISNFRQVASLETALEYDIVFNEFLDSYSEKNLGGRIWPTVVNLFSSDKPAIVTGNSLGGIHVLRNDGGSSLPDDAQVHIYPNPVFKDEELRVRSDRHGTIEVFSALGQQVSTPQTVKANEIYRFKLPHLSAGLYLLRFTSNKKSQTQRFVIR